MKTQLKTMTALVRRELWEHRGFWTVPAVISSLLTLLLIRVGAEVVLEVPAEKIAQANARLAADGTFATLADQVNAASLVFVGIGLTIGSIMTIVASFYLLDSLYGDRRDRSILFWRSMPITDVQTVLSKVVTATLAGPAVLIGVLAGAFVVWGSLAAAFGLAVGFDHWYIGLNPLAWVSAIATIAGIAIGAGLIAAPFVGWLTMASAWAPRAPFLWAVIPVAAVAMLEEMVFDTSYFIVAVLGHPEALFPKMFGENFEGFGIRGDVHDSIRIVGGMDLSAAFLLEPRLWLGVAVGAAFLAGAVLARRYRDDSAY